MAVGYRHVESPWSVRSLTEPEGGRVLSFLEREPLLNVFLISRVRDEGVVSASMIEVRHGDRTVCIASVSTNIVLAADRSLGGEEIQAAVGHLASRLIESRVPIRAIISEADLVDALWRRVEPYCDPPTVARLNQPIYALSHNEELPDLGRVRFSTISDLGALVPACAAMHLEEVGINPLDRDPYGYRERIRELVIARRSLVLMEGRKIAFKCEFSAVTGTAVQLMGVWTAPQFRRKGYGRLGMREVCGHILRQGKQVALFVNDFNTPAVRLYESLGFRRIGTNRALIW
jgi:uncharacterized protein